MIKYSGKCKYCGEVFKYERVFCFINDGKLIQTELQKLCPECVRKQTDLNLEWLGYRWSNIYGRGKI